MKARTIKLLEDLEKAKQLHQEDVIELAVKHYHHIVFGLHNVIEKYVAIYGEAYRTEITSCVELVLRREYWQQKKWNWDHYFEDYFS